MNSTVFEEKGEMLIEQFGLTKAEFARRMGIQRQNVKSVFKSCKLDTIRRAADALGAELWYLLSYTRPIDFNEEPFASMIESKRPSESHYENTYLEIRPEDVPVGDSVEDVRIRKNMIYGFYAQWRADNPEQKLFNISLNEYINIRSISVEETAEHASKRYLSTIAVFQLEAILSNARVIRSVPSKQGNTNQNPFERMLIMNYDCVGIGRIKLTVGVKRSDRSKIQYCITAIDTCEKNTRA